MKTKILAAGLALFGLINIAGAQTLVTNVTAVPLWTDSGLYVTNGEWVSVNAAGNWSWTSSQGPNDPDGFIDYNTSDLWIFNSIQGSLIAFIGHDPYQGSQWQATNGVFQTNQYVEVGTAGQFMSTTNGELWLGINDDAFVGPTSDNSGSNYVAVSLGFSHCDCYSNMTLSVAEVSSNSFGFYISNGIPNTVSAIYDSADLVHWTLLDSLVLDANGSSISARDVQAPSGTSGLQNGAFLNNTGVPYRFYKVSNGQFWSQAIGFERITVEPGTTNSWSASSYIANQLITPNNTLNGLFNPMADGTTLPNGSIIESWTGVGFNLYTYSGGTWSPNGSLALNPGQGAILVVTNKTIVTFAGLVPQGCLTNVLLGNYYNLVSSQVPQAGGITSVLGYEPSTNRDQQTILIWNGGSYNRYTYLNCSDSPSTPGVAGWYDFAGNLDEPILNVGESFYLWTSNVGTNTTYWIRKFPGCCGQ